MHQTLLCFCLIATVFGLSKTFHAFDLRGFGLRTQHWLFLISNDQLEGHKNASKICSGNTLPVIGLLDDFVLLQR